MAELSEYIAPIIAPDLGSPEFSTSLVEAFNTIDSNFKKIIQAPYLKGDRGASIETVILKRPDHEVDDNPSEYKKLQDAIIGGLNTIYYPQGRQATPPIDVTNDKLPGVGVNSADKLVQEDHFTVFKDFSTNEMYLICPYIFIDARIQYLDQITEGNRCKFIDTSSIVTGKYTRGNEGVYQWTIDISTNIPKLYFDDQSGYYCWLVNNEKTGIIAQGVKGADGIDGNIILCQGDRDSQDSESRIVIKKVYQQQSSSESSSQSISSTVYEWVPVGSNTPDLENHPVLVYGYDRDDMDREGNYTVSPKYIQFGIAFVDDTAEGTSASNTPKRYYIVYKDTLDLVKIIRENSIAKLLETISNSGSVQGLYISSERDENTIRNVHMFWNDSNNEAHLSKVPYTCVTQGAQDSDSIRYSKLHVDYDTIVNGDSTICGDSTIGGDLTTQGATITGGLRDSIRLQSTQGIQGTIGLQSIQHTTGDIGECELALVPSFNVSIKTEHDLSTTISGVQRLDKTILRVQTPWIGYIKSSSSTSGGIRTDNHSLYEACQLVDENGSNEYVIDITQQNNSTLRVPFWTKIPNHELGISSMFATDNEDIYVHVFQQERVLYGSIISDYGDNGNNTYSKYYLNFLVQVVLIKNPTNRVYATVIYKLLNTHPNISMHTSVDEYQSLYIALNKDLNHGDPNLYSEYIDDTYFATADTLYFDVIQRHTGTPLSIPISLDVVKCNVLSDNMNNHNTNMFTWVKSLSYTMSINDTNHNIILGYVVILSRIGVTAIDNPIYSKIIDTPTKLSIRQQSSTPIISDYVSTISMRSSKFRKCSMQLGTIQGSGSNSVCSIVTIYLQSGIFMNDLRLYTLHDVIDYNVNVFQTTRNNRRYLYYKVLTSADNPIAITTRYSDVYTISDGSQGANSITDNMVLERSYMKECGIIQDIYNDNSITVQGSQDGDMIIRQAYIEKDDLGGRSVKYTKIGNPYRIYDISNMQAIQDVMEYSARNARIDISKVDEDISAQFICISNVPFQHILSALNTSTESQNTQSNI